jgi:hypothetical protein
LSSRSDFGAADEEDVALADVLDPPVAAHHQRPAADPLAAHGLVEVGAERVLADHADDERGLGVVEGAGRPLDELGEIEEKHGLDPILGRRRGGRTGRRQGRA